MLSIIIPAHEEEAHIGPCLDALLASEGPRVASVTVVANGCTDRTAEVARERAPAAHARGWRLEVIERPRGHKPSALDAGDDASPSGARAYLDADVRVSPGLMGALEDALATDRPAYASGRVNVVGGANPISRAYGRVHAQMPFFTQGVPGAGLYAVNEAGRARWGRFPDIIADDAFVRLNFAPEERRLVDERYDWPVVQGAGALMRVRRRQEAGMAELARAFPELMANDDPRPSRAATLARIALKDPWGAAVYAAITGLARARRASNPGWSRGR